MKNPAARMVPGHWLAWAVGVAVLVLLTWHATRLAAPEPPIPLSIRITFPKGMPNRVEPLVCTGRYGAGDFLVINFVNENSATLSYDSWGRGGPTSATFTFTPGTVRTMTIDMPSLRLPRPGVTPEPLQPLRVTLDGRKLFEGPVRFHTRRPDQLYFGENPIGGNTAWAVFRGRLTTEDGRVLLGSHRSLFPWRERFAVWRTQPWRVAAVVLASLIAALAARPVVRLLITLRPSARSRRVFAARSKAAHGWFAGSAAACLVAFAALVTDGTFQFIFPESFGEFYDYQAASLLHGRLDVPEPALSGEAFVVDGKTYGYFGVTPAVLRLPLTAAGVAFGRLSRSYLTLYFAACLVAAYLLLCHAVRIVARDPASLGPRLQSSETNPVKVWPSAIATVLLTFATGLGSTLLFLGARAYVYHEAILCGAAFALWSVYGALRWHARPGSRWWIGALITGLFAIHARPTSGLFALCTLGCVALLHLATAVRSGSWKCGVRPAGIGVLALVAILSFNGMSYLKFGTFDGSPLRYSVQYTPDRVANFEGKNFHFSNLAHNSAVYFSRGILEVQRRFPYFFMGDCESDNYPAARVDLEEPTLSLPFAMPALFALALLGGGWALYSAPRLRLPMFVTLAGVAPMTGALLMAVVTSHRYTGDFCPFFVVWAACGLAVMDGETRNVRRWLLAVTAVLTLASAAITSAIALHFQRDQIWGVPDDAKQRYVELRKRVDAFFGVKPVKR